MRPHLLIPTFAISLSVTGCVFVDGDASSNAGTIRGYTYCGDFADEEVWCHPGQYCEDPVFTTCEIGCLSDVNCASNQFCDINAHGEAGTCRNAATSEQALRSDTGLAADLAVDDAANGTSQ